MISSTTTTTLDTYFGGMSSSLLSAEGEVQLAQKLRAQDEALWHALLSFVPLLPALCKQIQERLDPKKEISFRALLRAATAYKKGANTKTKDRLHHWAQEAAEQLRFYDPDQDLVLALLHWIPKEHNELKAHLAVLQQHANHSRNRFVECNLGLVVGVAKRYRFSGMPLEDLIQEGNLGLLRAVSRFDERKGYRFSTYATWWIRHGVGRSVSDKSRTIRIPVHVAENEHKLNKVQAELLASLGRPPTRGEVAKHADMNVRKLEMTRMASSASKTAMSLDAPISEGNQERIEIFCSAQESVFDALAQQDVSRQAQDALESLAPLEQEILHRRFGLAGKTAATLQDIATHIGKSRERIRQIQEKALEKLRVQLLKEQAI